MSDTPKSLFSQEEAVEAQTSEPTTETVDSEETPVEETTVDTQVGESVGEMLDGEADPTPSLEDMTEANREVFNEQYSPTANQNVAQDDTITRNYEAVEGNPELNGEDEVEIPEMSTAQYEAVQRAIARRLQDAKSRDRAADLNTVKVLMAKHGFKSSELRTEGGSRKSGGKVAPKYRNPENPEQTWTGRGIAPKWIADVPKDERDQFLIQE